MFPDLQFLEEMFPFVAAGPSQGSPPVPHAQTKSNCIKLVYWFKLEWVYVG